MRILFTLLLALLPAFTAAMETAGSEPAPVAAEPAAQASAPPAPVPAVTPVVMTTELGEIHVALEHERAPVTAANFLRYVDLKRFDGITFYRAVRIDEEGRYGLLQGGLRSDPKKVLKPIAFEAPSATGLSHVDGAISMAHLTPGSATADWFIVIGDLVSLDGNGTPEDTGYAVFGRVTAGMDVVRQILAQPADPNAGEGMMKGQMLARPVKIVSVRRAP